MEMRWDTAKRELFLEVAWSFLHTPYTWGGDDPTGIDCSGLAVECLKTVGLFPRKSDATAHQLMVLFEQFIMPFPYPGCLVFWVNEDSRAFHVEIAYDSEHTIGASGGGSQVRNLEDAIRHNAFVKIRPWRSRPAPGIVFIDPFRSYSDGPDGD